MIWLMVLWNLFVSWSNAKFVAYNWRVAGKGGFAWWINGCAAVMSACGFTWCYALLYAHAGHALGYLSAGGLRAVQELVYVAIIFPVLGTGLGITLYTLERAWRSGDGFEIANGLYNVGAQVHNTAGAIRELPGVFEHLGGFFGGSSKSDKDNDNPGAALVVLLAGVAMLAGVATTWWIISSTVNDTHTRG